MGVIILIIGGAFAFNNKLNNDRYGPRSEKQDKNLSNNFKTITMDNNLRLKLETASKDAIDPIFDDIDQKQFPVKFFDAVQVGNHAAYIKSQQPDEGSINFLLLGYDFKNGDWKMLGQYSNNFLFLNSDPQSQENIQGMKDKVLGMEDKYFSKNAVIDM